jgi:uncharacterized OB-fold protein
VPITSPWTCEEAEVRESRQQAAGSLINGFGNGFGAYCRQHGHFVPRDQFCPYCRSELSRRRRADGGLCHTEAV